jgi:DNA-binding response OmpR family regulator
MTKLLKIPPEKANPPCRILLVDDEPLPLELNAVALIRFGYDVDTAEDGAAAWKALHDANIRYDLLITDNKMPRVTGLELIKKLRSEEMNLPIIMASGMVPTEELKQYPWLKLDATLPKPFTTAELLDTVKKVLRTTESANASLQLMLRDYALRDDKISKAKKPLKTPIRKQINPSHRILVVDDDEDIRRLNTEVLSCSGYKVDAAADGAVAWGTLQLNRYHLLVTDYNMPKMSGIELIKKLHAARMALPVILVSGTIPVEKLKRHPWLQINATLLKPYTSDDLLATVRKVLHPTDGIPGRVAPLPGCQGQSPSDRLLL